MSRPGSRHNVPDAWDASDWRPLRRKLRAWYRKHARKLPWRMTGDPYLIWISEVMLQQTTVATVVPYFERFRSRFPDVRTLAAAEQDEVLRLWEGLGYYSRARNIHRAAQQIVQARNGEFPQTVEELVKLPGVGRYTAGAIVSFAFDLPAPIVEANTLRLYSRLLCLEVDPRSTQGQRQLWDFAALLVPSRSPGEFNQALMELGSRICTPSEPDCPSCPLATGCRARAEGRQHDVPVAAPKTPITQVVEFAVAIECEGRYLVRQYPEGQRWAGLWDFYRFSVASAEDLLPAGGLRRQRALPPSLVSCLREQIAAETGHDVAELRFLREIRHSVTRYRIRLQCVHAESPDGSWVSEGFRLVAPEQLTEMPLSTTGRQLAELIVARHGEKKGQSLF